MLSYKDRRIKNIIKSKKKIWCKIYGDFIINGDYYYYWW